MRRHHSRWAALLAFVVGASPGGAQVRVTSDIPDDYVDPSFSFVLTVAGEPAEGERLAVLVGPDDVSGLMTAVSGGLRYPAHLLPLPTGTSDVVVHRVDAGGTWRRVTSFDLKVRNALGVEETRFAPGLDLNVSGQPAHGEIPEPGAATGEPDVLDGSVQLDAGVTHRAFETTGTAVLVGTSELERRLRYRDLEDGAPLLDLASYRVDHRQGPVALSVGHVRTGVQRHLVDGFGSRGATVTVSPGSRLDVSLAANAGRQEVGWGNLVGVGDPEHRILSANVGLDALERPGALRVDVGWMDGSILPRSAFGQGAVTDAEASHGLSVRLRASGLDRRLTLDAGWSRSAFDNPDDPALSQGRDLVDVLETRRGARYLDADVDVLRRVPVGGSRTTSLSVAYRHERVDPLYRTVGAGVRADVLHDRVEMRGDLAGVGVQAAWVRERDNLDAIASILTTNTARRSVNLTVPLARMAGTPWAPSVQLRHDRTHQEGQGVPTDGGFSPGHVPDQVSVDRTASAEWRGRKASFRWQVAHTDQDNRQEGREDDDFRTLTHGFGVGLTPWSSVRLGVDFGLERADDLGRDVRGDTRRWGANAQWQPLDRSTLSLRWSDTFEQDREEPREQLGRSFDLKWSSAIPGASALGGTWFVRYHRTESVRLDRIRDIDQDRSRWAVTLGASLGWRNP